MPYTDMARQLDVPSRIDQLRLRSDQSVAVICATANRSSTATSLLSQRGYGSLYNVTGGMEAWKNAGFPVVETRGDVSASRSPKGPVGTNVG